MHLYFPVSQYEPSAQGKVLITCFELCQVLLMDDSNFPCWLVLVPQQNGVTVRCRPSIQLPAAIHTALNHCQQRHPACPQEVIDLPQKDQQLLWEEVARASRALRATFPDPALKLNIGALGNVVRQLMRSVPRMLWHPERSAHCISMSA